VRVVARNPFVILSYFTCCGISTVDCKIDFYNKKNYMENRYLTIPNIISTVRIIIVVFAAKELIDGNNLNSFILYFIAALTDFLDGFLARKLNQISELGKILDPLTDKLMIGSAIIILFLQNRMPLWYVAIIIGRDLFNLFGGLLVSRKIKFVLPSILIGKVAAVVTMFTFGLNIINFQYIEYFYYASASLVIISTLKKKKKAIEALKQNNLS
jgi:CDP-diacylglycerol--glycerol-3-phosphate 3-phosphatidyltransferase